MGKAKDMVTIDDLLEQPVLTEHDRKTLYRLANRHNVPMRRRRFESLMHQGCLFRDDVNELRMLAAALDEQVNVVRIELEE